MNDHLLESPNALILVHDLRRCQEILGMSERWQGRTSSINFDNLDSFESTSWASSGIFRGGTFAYEWGKISGYYVCSCVLNKCCGMDVYPICDFEHYHLQMAVTDSINVTVSSNTSKRILWFVKPLSEAPKQRRLSTPVMAKSPSDIAGIIFSDGWPQYRGWRKDRVTFYNQKSLGYTQFDN